MSPRTRARLLGLIVIVLGLGLATGLGLYAMRDNVSFFYAPSDLRNGTLSAAALDRAFRIGGLVKTGSVERTGKEMRFTITDLSSDVTITYSGVVPDLFREGQGVVAYGHYDAASNIFTAKQILARHDENYMAPEVKDALERAKTGTPATPQVTP